MDAQIHRAGVALKMGSHNDVEHFLQEMEGKTTISELLSLFDLLQQQLTNRDAEPVYTNFIALKILRFYLSRYPSQWVDNGEALIAFLLRYGKAVCEAPVSGLEGGRALVLYWRPVFSELAATFGLALKLRCIYSKEFSISYVVKGLLSMLRDDVVFMNSQAKGPGAGLSSSCANLVVLHRSMVQRAVEEFGLYDKPSRRRGIPIRWHIHWRKAMEEEGLLDFTEFVANTILQPLTAETGETIDAALSLLVSCLSWFKHRYVDADEDAAEEDTTDSFEVKGGRWISLLFGTEKTQPPHLSSLAFVLLERFNMFSSPEASALWDSHSLSSLSSCLAQIVQAIRLICSFHLPDVEMGECFASPHFSLCLHMMESCVAALARPPPALDRFPPLEVQEVFQGLLPVLANGIRRLLSNFSHFFARPSSEPVLYVFATVTEGLLLSDFSSLNGDMSSYQGVLDEVLNGWLTLVFLQDSSPSSNEDFTPALGALTKKVFIAYLQRMRLDQLRQGRNSMNDEVTSAEEAMECSATEQTCHQIAGRLARLSGPDAGVLLQAVMKELADIVVGASSPAPGVSPPPNALFLQNCSNALTLFFRVTLHYTGDYCEGEQPCIPRCFLVSPPAAEGAVMVMADVMSFYTLLLSTPLSRLPLTHELVADVVERFIRTYIEAEESNAIFTECFSQGAEVITFALQMCEHYLQCFPTTDSKSICRLLSAVSDKSVALRTAVSQLPEFHQIVHYVHSGFNVAHPLTLGRVAASAATCISPVDLFASMPYLLDPLLPTAHPDALVYKADCLRGMAQFLSRPDALKSQYCSFAVVAKNVIESSFLHLEGRLPAIHAALLVRELFIAFSIALDDDGVTSLIQLVDFSLQQCVSSLQNRELWFSSQEAVNDRHELLLCVEGMLYDIALWKALDCFLSDKEIASLEQTTINALVFLFESISAEEREIPEIDNALFNALEHCCNSFTASFVNHAKSSCFMDAIVYAIQQENSEIQLAGVHVIATVSSFLCRGEGLSANEGVLRNFVAMLLRAAVRGNTSFRNTKHLCRAILKISRNVSECGMTSIFQNALEESSDLHAVLHQLYEGLQTASQETKSESEAFAYFESVVENSIMSLDVIHLTAS